MDHHWLLYMYARERLHELAQQAADQRLRTEAKAADQDEPKNSLFRASWRLAWLKSRRLLFVSRTKAINL